MINGLSLCRLHMTYPLFHSVGAKLHYVITISVKCIPRYERNRPVKIIVACNLLDGAEGAGSTSLAIKP